MKQQQSPDFTDIIIQSYLGHRVSQRSLPSAIKRLGMEGPLFDKTPYTELQAAVAEVLLKSIRDDLPQWAVVQNGKVTLGRHHARSRYRWRRYRPLYLFTINWADSGPGFSWPMAYYATTVSWAGEVIVTASADGPDTYGWADMAIGHFPANNGHGALDGIRKVIIADWSAQAARGQREWAELFGRGEIPGALAMEWAEQVRWPKDDVWGRKVSDE